MNTGGLDWGGGGGGCLQMFVSNLRNGYSTCPCHWFMSMSEFKHKKWSCSLLACFQGPCHMSLKARTHRPIFRGLSADSAVESAASITGSADSTTDFVIVGRLPVFNIFPHRSSKPILVSRLFPSVDCKPV